MTRCATLLIVLGLLAVLPATAHAAKCAVPDYPGSGEFTSLKVTHVSCADGAKVARGYYTCRTKRAPAGRCVAKVRGYSCSEKRTATAAEIVATVTCKNGSRKVVHGYRQTL